MFFLFCSVFFSFSRMLRATSRLLPSFSALCHRQLLWLRPGLLRGAPRGSPAKLVSAAPRQQESQILAPPSGWWNLNPSLSCCQGLGGTLKSPHGFSFLTPADWMNGRLPPLPLTYPPSLSPSLPPSRPSLPLAPSFLHLCLTVPPPTPPSLYIYLPAG